MKIAQGLLLAALHSTAMLSAQMEMRATDLYDPATFARFSPPVGTLAPDLTLTDLAGNPWSLASHRGRPVVLIKGSYT